MKMTARHPLHAIYLLLALCALAFQGCASITQPQNFEQRLAYAYGAQAASRNALADAITAKRITPERARVVQTELDATRALLDVARKAAPAEAQASLSKAEAKLKPITKEFPR